MQHSYSAVPLAAGEPEAESEDANANLRVAVSAISVFKTSADQPNELFPLPIFQMGSFVTLSAGMPVYCVPFTMLCKESKGRNEALNVTTGMMTCTASVHVVGDLLL